MIKSLKLAALGLVLASAALAQNATVAFGGLKHDTTLPVEITADELTVDQNTGTAVFIGNVVAGQGEMRLTAARVRVQYATQNGEPTGRIDRLFATGGVTLVNGPEAAEAQEAVYAVSDGEVVMTGDVILTQGANALAGEKLTVDLSSGTGRMSGRVRTIFQTGGN